LISGNNGKGFVSFLLQVATLIPDVRNVWEVSLSLIWVVVVGGSIFYALKTSEPKGPGILVFVLFSILWIGLSAAVVAMGGMKGGSNGYIADRVNGGLSSGASFMLSGLFVFGFRYRKKLSTVLSFAAVGLFLFLAMFSSLLQLGDWRYLGREEEKIRTSLELSGLISEVTSSNPILLSGVPHVLSSFPHKSNPNFSGAEVYSDYKFTPLPLYVRWPDADALTGRFDVALYRVDAFHRVRCLNGAILLEPPVGLDNRDGEWSRTNDGPGAGRGILGGVYVARERDGRFIARRLTPSNCSMVIPDEFRAS
jgi:hypothetical protein